MTPQESQLVEDLFDRLAKLETLPRDPAAERLIADGTQRAPHALYALVQTALVQDEAVKAAEESVQIALNQYKSGTVSYLNVVTAQTAALTNERTALTVLSNRLTANVTIIKALGGSWDTSQLPSD